MTDMNKNKKRKEITLLLIAVALFIIIIAAAFIMIQKMNTGNTAPTTTENSPISPTAVPSPAVTQTPTITPIPAVSQDDYIGLYPAYQSIDGVNKYGYIDSSGAFVIQPAYDSANDFSDGLAIVTEGSNYKVITPDGTVIFENDNTITSFQNQTAAFQKVIDNVYLYGYIDINGKVIIEPQFLTAGDFNEEGQAYVTTPEETYELIDTTGAVLETFEPQVNNGYVYDYKDGYVVYYDSNTSKFGVNSVRGEVIFQAIYSEISYLGHDLFAIKEPQFESYETMTKPAAIFNAKGEQLTDYTLYDLHPFDGEYTSAADETSIYFIGTDGKEETSLPSFDGGGTLTMLGDTIKAEIDSDLIYYKKDNTILWQSATSTVLSPELKVNRIKFKPLRTVLVYYPQVEGMADSKIQAQVNADLEEIFTEYRQTITEEDMLTVSDSFRAELFNDLLVISMSGYDYYSGAAHGMPIWEHYFIDTVTGEFYDLKDLFITDSDYKPKINEIISSRMKIASEKEDTMYFSDQFTGISNDQNFYLTDSSLVIYFNPYEVAAYAAGFPEFEIPFEDLSDYINKDGAFWKAFQQN